MKYIAWYIHVRCYETDALIHKVGPVRDKRSAERAQRGVEINLDQRKFYTEIMKGNTL